jgi:hypothetical protein
VERAPITLTSQPPHSGTMGPNLSMLETPITETASYITASARRARTRSCCCGSTCRPRLILAIRRAYEDHRSTGDWLLGGPNTGTLVECCYSMERCRLEDLVTVMLAYHLDLAQRAFPWKLALSRPHWYAMFMTRAAVTILTSHHGQTFDLISPKPLIGSTIHRKLHDKHVPAASTSPSRPHPLDETFEPRHKRIPSFVTSTSCDQASGTDADRTCDACHSISHKSGTGCRCATTPPMS